MAKHKVEIQDHLGNIYYPHTTTDVVFDQSGQRLSSLLDNKIDVNVTRHNFQFSSNIAPLPDFLDTTLSNNYYKVGKIVFLELKCLKNQAISPQSGYIGIGTLPIGFRPSKEVSNFCIFLEKIREYYYKRGYGIVTVFTDGQVSLSYIEERTFGFSCQISFLI